MENLSGGRLTGKQVIAILGLPENTNTTRLRARTLRTLCAGGNELVDAKEWAAGVATRTGDGASMRTAEVALEKLHAIELAMLSEVEGRFSLPKGTLTEPV